MLSKSTAIARLLGAFDWFGHYSIPGHGTRRISGIRYKPGWNGWSDLRGPELCQKSVERAAQHARLAIEFAGVRQHVGCGRAGRGRGCGNPADVGADLVRSGRNGLNVARDLAGRIALLVH